MTRHPTTALQALAAHPRIALARLQAGPKTGLPTGHQALDDLLPEGGWPRRALTELLVPRTGQGEFGLLAPALARLSRERQWIVLVAPPWIPYPHALTAAGIGLRHLRVIRADNDRSALWAMDQCLRSGAFGAVLGWPGQLSGQALRRLQLAAENGDNAVFLTRPAECRPQHSTAALRIALERRRDQLRLELVKCRGRLHQTQLSLPCA